MREPTTQEWSRRAHALFTSAHRGPIDDAPWLTFVGAFAAWSLLLRNADGWARIAVPAGFALWSAMPVMWSAAGPRARRRMEVAAGLVAFACSMATRSVEGAIFTVLVAGMSLLLAALFTAPVIAAQYRVAASPITRSRGGEAALLAMYGAAIFMASRYAFLENGGSVVFVRDWWITFAVTSVMGVLTAWIAVRGIWWELRARATVRAVLRGDAEGWRADDAVDRDLALPSLTWLSLGAQGGPARTPSVLCAARPTLADDVYRQPAAHDATRVCAVPRRVGAMSAMMVVLAAIAMAVGAGFVTALAR